MEKHVRFFVSLHALVSLSFGSGGTDTLTVRGGLKTERAYVNSAAANTIPYLNANKEIVSSITSYTQLGFLDATSSIQTQLNGKASSTHNHGTGTANTIQMFTDELGTTGNSPLSVSGNGNSVYTKDYYFTGIYSTGLLINTNSVDGTDNKKITIASAGNGGYSGTTRGASIIVSGNETADKGDINIYAGDGSSGYVGKIRLNGPVVANCLSPGYVVSTDATNNVLVPNLNLTAFDHLNTIGFPVRIGSNSWLQRSIAVSGSGLLLSNGDGGSGNPTLSLDIGSGSSQVAVGNHNHGTGTVNTLMKYINATGTTGNSNISDDGTVVSINGTTKIYNNGVKKTESSSAGYIVWENLANIRANSYTGFIKITLPSDWTSITPSIQINITNVSGDYNIDASGYYVSGLNWVFSKYSCLGAGDIPVRFGFDGSKPCIVIGNSSTFWNTLSAGVTRLIDATYTNDYSTGTTLTLISTDAGITFVSSDKVTAVLGKINCYDAATFNSLTASTVPYLNASKALTSSSISPTKLEYLTDVTSNIQAQLSGKEPTIGNPSTNGYIPSRTTAGVWTWIAPPSGGTYTHPAYTARTPTLSGSSVFSSFTSDALGHVTALTTRTLTPANIGAEPTIGNPSTNGYIPSRTASGTWTWIAPPAGGTYTHPAYTARTPTLSGSNVFSSFTSDALGHVTTASTRVLTPADIGASEIITGSASSIVNTGLSPSKAVITGIDGKITQSTTTSAEILQSSGLTGNIQAQLNNKEPLIGNPSINGQIPSRSTSGDWTWVTPQVTNITGAATTIVNNNLSSNRVLVSDGNGKVSASGTPTSAMTYIANLSSDAQQQLNSKVSGSGLGVNYLLKWNGSSLVNSGISEDWGTVNLGDNVMTNGGGVTFNSSGAFNCGNFSAGDATVNGDLTVGGKSNILKQNIGDYNNVSAGSATNPVIINISNYNSWWFQVNTGNSDASRFVAFTGAVVGDVIRVKIPNAGYVMSYHSVPEGGSTLYQMAVGLETWSFVCDHYNSQGFPIWERLN